MLFYRQRKVGAAFDRGIVGHDHDFTPGHTADAGDDAGTGGLVLVEAVGGELRNLQEGRTRIQERVDALAGQQFAARRMAFPHLGRAAERDRRDASLQFRRERRVDDRIGPGHPPATSSLPIRKRRISLVPAPIS